MRHPTTGTPSTTISPSRNTSAATGRCAKKSREPSLAGWWARGGRSHWSLGGGMQWLTGHWEWHAISSYVLVPLDGEPTLVFSMGGTHAEACRRECANALSDVRHSRSGKYAEVMVER